MTGPITLPFVTTFNDKGVKQGQASLATLAKSSIAGAVSVKLVVDQLGKAVRAAADDQKAQQQLELAVRNNTDATTAQIAEMERTIGSMEMQKAVADDVLRPSLASLVRATGDVTKAQGLLNLALDISAGTGRDLESVSLALARAQTGQFTALTRLGIPLDAAAVKSKDLDAIQKELAIRFAGASDAAANSADGGMRKLQIALDNTYEAVGYRLLPVLGDYVTVLSDIAGKALNAEGSQNKFVGTFARLFKLVGPGGGLIKGFETINRLVGDYADSIDNARGKQYDYTNISQRMNYGMNKLKVTTEETAEELKRLAEAKRKAKEAAKDYADTLRDRVQTAMDTVTTKVEAAQQAFDGFKDSLSDQLRGFVSLSDAVRTQTDAESDLQDALQDRRDAYTALAKLDPTADAEAYAQALLDVAAAETKVGAASSARASSDYSKVFLKQIEDAKVFGANLQRLVQSGLSQDGLAQLINLGPVAGRQVTQDIIDNTNGMNLGNFVSSLADLRASGDTLGTTGANAFFGASLGAAQSAQGQVNQYQITVNAGLISNPAQVGLDIIEAIQKAERISGKVFVSV